MRYVASYLLAALGGNSSPSAKDIKKILDSVGIEADDDWLNKVISELNGKNIEDVIAQGEVVFEALVCTVHSNPCRSACGLPGFACGPEHPRSLTQRSEQGLRGLMLWALLDNPWAERQGWLCPQ